MKRWMAFLIFGVLISGWPLVAQEPTGKPEDPAHNELRAVRDDVIKCFKQHDIDGILKHAHKNVVVIWQNGERNRGPAEVKGFYDRVMAGGQSVVASLDSKLEVDDLAVLYPPNTAVAYGTLDDHYTLRDGMVFDLHSRWTATLVKEDNRWLISSFQAGTNMFDNGVLNVILKKEALYVGGIAGAIGILVGIGLCLVVNRLRKRPA
jgi:ketosteroid isomerase-like protein